MAGIQKTAKPATTATTPAATTAPEDVAPDTTGAATGTGNGTDTTPTPKRGPGAPRGKRGPRGESIAWTKVLVQTLARELRKMGQEGGPVTPMRLAARLSDRPEFESVRHLLEDAQGSMRVSNKVKELNAAIEAAQAEGRNVPSLPQFSTARGPRLDLAELMEGLGEEE